MRSFSDFKQWNRPHKGAMQWAKEDGIIIKGPLINDVTIFEKTHTYKKGLGVKGKKVHIWQYSVSQKWEKNCLNKE